jgi:hypothetical protein
LKRTFSLSILAVVSAALMPLAATSQLVPVNKPVSADKAAPSYKYAVYAGYAYTSINQVNQSRYGLQGGRVAVTRNFGKYFGVFADGAQYRYALNSAKPGNPGTPTVTAVLFGPEFHANLYGRFDGMFHILLGGEHTGGEGMTPKVSFAGGVGGGLEYRLSPRLSLRAAGDEIAASFSLNGNTPALAYSPHMTKNASATFGVVYRF